jgi:methionyl-tRNA formyltransferase
MKQTSETVVFFGSGPVAAESLQLLSQQWPIEAVVTKPRAAHHKGNVPVLALAEELHLPVYTTTNKNSLDELFARKPFRSDLAILIDFGIIVSQAVIDYFPLGIINSHFSLLPEWRGADPITFSVLSGQKQTGVSLMLLTAGMDEGPLLGQGLYNMPPQITTPALTSDLIQLSNALLGEILPLYRAGRAQPADQLAVTLASSTIPTYSRKLSKEDGIIDFSKPADVLEREIRAFIEWPKSTARLGSVEAILTKVHVVQLNGTPGETVIIDKLPVVYCGHQALAIDSLKPTGKKEMTGESFLAGYKSVFLS